MTRAQFYRATWIAAFCALAMCGRQLFAADAIEALGKAADFDVTKVSGQIMGWNVRESAATAAAATLIIRNNVVAAGSCSGDVLVAIELSANESGGTEYNPPLSFTKGVCGDVLAGTVDFILYVTR